MRLDTHHGDTELNIPIGIIGPKEFMPKMKEILKGFPSFQPIIAGYSHESEAAVIAERLMQEVEVLFFTGPIPYRIAKDSLHFTVPTHYIPLTGAGLYRALFRLQQQSALSAVSIDILSRQTVQTMLEELGMSTTVVHPGEGRQPDSEALIRFHRSSYERGETTAAITGIRSVSEALTECGVPNQWVVPTDQDVVVNLERALLSTQTRRSKESQIVLGLIHIDDYGKLAEKQSSEHEAQKLRLDIHRMLIDYVESLEGYLTHFGGEEYMFVMTRGVFERETGGYKYIPLAGEAEKSFGLTLSIGIGFGRSASDAGTHARVALRQAKDAGGNICFIVREDGGVIGPLEMSRPLDFSLSLLDAELIGKAESSGMSVAYLSKLAAQAAQKGKIEYLAQELASVLGVTVRSAHRCLQIWMDAGLVDIVGEERSSTKGRPRQIYRFSFLAEQLVKKPVR